MQLQTCQQAALTRRLLTGERLWMVPDLMSQLDLAQRKLKDSERLLQQTDAKNFDFSMSSYYALLRPLACFLVS